jgi:hypothetical protein
MTFLWGHHLNGNSHQLPGLPFRQPVQSDGCCDVGQLDQQGAEPPSHFLSPMGPLILDTPIHPKKLGLEIKGGVLCVLQYI